MLKKLLWVLILSLSLSGCYSSGGEIRLFNRYSLFGKASTVKVVKGDTLYSIARSRNIPLKDLIQCNNLRPPYNLRPGQILRLPENQYHIIKKGDTLYSISRQYNVDVTTLSRKNNLTAPYTLNVGQRLVLSGTISGQNQKSKTQAIAAKPSGSRKYTASTPYVPPKKRTAKFQWPVQGRILSGFGTTGKGRKNDGINISAPRGSAVKAADKGTVAYAGNELKGFGNLILIKHTDGWITAYAHNEKLLVRKGQKVVKGEKIATVGSTGGVNSPQLHFEVRAGKKAVNPRQYLP